MESGKINLSDKDSRMYNSFESPAPVEGDAEKRKGMEKKDPAESKKAKKKRLAQEAKDSKQPWADKPKEDQPSPDRPKEIADQLKPAKEPEITDNLEAELTGDPEKLAPDETALVVAHEAEAMAEDAAVELGSADPGTSQEAAALATAVFAESLRKHADQAEQGAEVDVQHIADETLNTLELELTEIAPDLDADVVEMPGSEESADIEPTLFDNDQDAEPETDELPAVASASSPPPPPRGPILPADTAAAPMSGGPAVGRHVPEARQPYIPRPTEAHAPERTRTSRAADMFVGGLVGYFIGRRRGRLHAEAAAHKVEKSLQKEIKELQQDLYYQNERIRKAAAQKVEANPTATQQLIEKTQAVRAEAQTVQPSVVERQPHYVQRAPEKLGRAVLAPAERLPDTAPETVAIPAPRPEATPASVLALPEMLQIAKDIRVDGVTAERMYQDRRLDSEGLKKVVTEYVRGGSPERILAQELKSAERRRTDSLEFMKPDTVGPVGQQHGGTAALTDSPASAQKQPDLTALPSEIAAMAQKDQPAHTADNTPKVAAGMVFVVLSVVILLLLIMA